MDRAFLEQLVTGSGLLYLVLLVLVVLALVIRRLSRDRIVRRRALLAVALLGLFAAIQIGLSFVPERTAGFVRTPQGELVPGLVENPAFQTGSVFLLLVGLLAGLLTLTLVLVDFLVVGRLRREVPNILRDVTIVALFFAGAIVILNARTDLDPAGLFTTAGVVSIVIGLALQDTLGNVFSGLALQTERSFNVGDWVRFGEREGVVTDISWRATKLRTRANDLVIIPNSVISKDMLINYSAPSRVHAILAQVGAHYRHPPHEVEAALEEAADQTPGILPKPRVDVRTKDYADSSIVYEIKYWIADYKDSEDISDDFMTRIWYAFDRRGIEIPFPIRNVYLRSVTPEGEKAAAEADDDVIYGHLRRADIFESLSEPEARAIAARARVGRYYGGETIVKQGDAGDSMFLIDTGKVAIVVQQDGKTERLAVLGSGAFLGEMALLTGEPRSATAVALEPTHTFIVDREALRETLAGNPALAEAISETLARRRAELSATQATLHAAARSAMSEESSRILGRIKDFFFG